MRLIDCNNYLVEEFPTNSIPPYAILSHTWGKEEVTFQDMQGLDREIVTQKQGYQKIRGACRQALKDGYKHIWIDTCCIDKSSSNELAEAITSMFRWYKNSQVCYRLGLRHRPRWFCLQAHTCEFPLVHQRLDHAGAYCVTEC